RPRYAGIQSLRCRCARKPTRSCQSTPRPGPQRPKARLLMPITIIPSIDLREGRVVRLQQGDYNRQLNYAVDPIETAKQFASAGAKWIHIVDLDGAKQGIPVQTILIGKISYASGLTVQAGARERR